MIGALVGSKCESCKERKKECVAFVGLGGHEGHVNVVE